MPDTTASDTTRPSEPLDLAAWRRYARIYAVFGDERGSLSATILSLLDRIEELRGLLVESRAEGDRCSLENATAHGAELVDRINAAIGDWRAP